MITKKRTLKVDGKEICIHAQVKRVFHNQRTYDVTGHPTIAEDHFPLVQVWVSETFQVRRTRCKEQVLVSDKSGHWRRLGLGPTRTLVTQLAKTETTA